jgi:hypothetical protein
MCKMPYGSMLLVVPDKMIQAVIREFPKVKVSVR